MSSNKSGWIERVGKIYRGFLNAIQEYKDLLEQDRNDWGRLIADEPIDLKLFSILAQEAYDRKDEKMVISMTLFDENGKTNSIECQIFPETTVFNEGLIKFYEGEDTVGPIFLLDYNE